MRRAAELNSTRACLVAAFPSARRRCLLLAFAGVSLFSLGSQARAEQIVLRNLDVLDNVTVSAMDENGARLKNGRTVSWDRIESGMLDSGQKKFDEFRTEIGDPLYRIRQRMKVDEDRDLSEPAEKLFPRFAKHRTQSAYVVFQALMWSRLAHGRREDALEAYLYCIDALKSSGAKLWILPGKRKLDYNPVTGLLADFTPVWFDEKAAKAAVARIDKLLPSLKQPLPPGAALYCATLALSAGEEETASAFLKQIKSPSRGMRELIEIAAAQREVLADKPGSAVEQLEKRLPRLQTDNRPLAYYWLGRADLQSKDERQRKTGVLKLLHIPVLYADTQPDLAAAALSHAAETLESLKDAKGASRLREELLDRFPQTQHAMAIERELKSEKSKEG